MGKVYGTIVVKILSIQVIEIPKFTVSEVSMNVLLLTSFFEAVMDSSYAFSREWKVEVAVRIYNSLSMKCRT